MPEKQTVLIVEDEPLVRVDIADHLTDAGYRVLEAANAAEAIAILETERDIQVIFTDVDMPGTMDGLMLAAAVADGWPPIRIIVASGHRVIEITDIPDGSVFFSKPYANDAIERAVRELIH